MAAPPAQPYRMAGPPAWVIPAPDKPTGGTKAVEAGESDYLLVDRQVRLSAVTESYGHYVERMVSQSSVDRAAQISIEIDPLHERVLLHDVHVIRDGRVIDKLVDARRSLMNREQDLDQGLINGRVTLHLLLQDVRVGDVLDYSYTLERTDPFGERGFNEWYSSQWGVPVRHVRLRVLHPANRPLHIKDHGKLSAPARIGRGAWSEIVWEGRDIAALPNDELRPSWLIYYPRVEISEFADWNAVRVWSQPLYTRHPEQDPALAALVAELRAESDESARILRALRFVQDDVRYTGLEMGVGAYRPTQPPVVLARRFGDCKDKVLLLVTLLRALGVEAYPALVHSELRRGLAERVPGPGAFDHVIAKVRWKGRDYWLDATTSGQGGRLDSLVQANFGLALVLDGSTRGLDPIPERQNTAVTHRVVENFDLRKGKDQTATLGVTTVYEDGEADGMRARMRARTATELGKDYLEYYRKSHAGIRMAAPLVLKDDRDRNQYTIVESYEIDKPFEKNAAGEWKFHFDAYLVTDLTGVPKQVVRSTPLARVFPKHVRHEIVAYLPGPWDIEAAKVSISDPAFEYRSEARFEQGRLALSYDLRHTADHVPVEALQPFLGKLDQAHDDGYFALTDSGEVAAAAAELAAPKGPNFPLLVTLLFGAGLGVFAAISLGRVRRRLPEATPGAPAGLGGWMVLPVIGVFLSPILLMRNIWTWFGDIGTAAQFATVEQHVQWMLLLVFLLMCVAILVAIATAVFMLKRTWTFPFAFVALQALNLVIMIVNAITLWMIGGNDVEAAHETNMLVLPILSTVLWVSYVLLSQRVRATFVKSWHGADGNPVPVPANP
jgi:transglutaminase-like putative cysteine protease